MPAKSTVRFDVSPEAAEHNASLLRAVNYEYPRFFKTQIGMTVGFEPDFSPLEQPSPLLCRHPGFADFAKVIVTGMPYRYTKEITEEERAQEVIAILAQGNHKLAQPRLSPRLSRRYFPRTLSTDSQ
jgi:hypothetical protein